MPHGADRQPVEPALTPATDSPALFIGSDIYRDSSYGRDHPLAIPRVSACIDLTRALGWLPDSQYVESPQATRAELERFHDPAYIRAVMAAEECQTVSAEVRTRHHIGINANPVFPEMFRRPATAVGAGQLAARLLRHGGVVYSPGGGQHHGRPDRASGFCYFNEPVLSIMALMEGGAERVFYLDIDAHHGDGVQDAFADDDRVFTLSIHEAGRWPLGRDDPPSAPGGIDDRAGGAARNLPVPRGFNDSELEYLTETVVLPLIQAWRPDALFVQGGCDALADDPQSRLDLSNSALWRVVAQVKDLAPRLLVVGGGGYNPWAVARAWAGIWGTLAGHDVPETLPEAAETFLRSLAWKHKRGRHPPEHWFTRLADPANPGPVRDEVRALARAALAD